jgi:hypothetical protein
VFLHNACEQYEGGFRVGGGVHFTYGIEGGHGLGRT